MINIPRNCISLSLFLFLRDAFNQPADRRQIGHGNCERPTGVYFEINATNPMIMP